MKTALILAILAAVAVAAFYFVWVNRASEKILTAVIPIAVAALVGIFLSVFVFGGQPPITVVFPSSFQYEPESKMPANLPWIFMSRRFTQSLFAPAQLYKVHPEYFSDPSDPSGSILYHHLLQKSIIDWMSTHYRGSWQSEAMFFESSVGREERFGPSENATEPSKVFSTTDVEKLLQGNKFGTTNTGIAPQIAVPPATNLEIKPPSVGATGGQIGEMVLENKFCTLSIRTQYSSWMSGVGMLQSLAGLTEEENAKLGTATYTVKVNIVFKRLRTGHPKMPLYKLWASGIAEGLKKQFDEEIIWSGTKSDYLFFKQTQQLGPVK